jgi:hypothetical protein
MIFLVCAPIVAFCLAFPSTGYLKWEADGAGVFYSPFFSTALGLSLLFFAPFLLPLCLFRCGKRAFYLFLPLAIVVSPFFVFSRWTTSLLPWLTGWSALFVAFGCFWLGTNRLGWVPLVQWHPKTTYSRTTCLVISSLLVLSLDIALTLGFSALFSSLFSGDCRGKPPFVHPESQSHAVFTARTVFVGRSIEALTREADLFHRAGIQNHRVGDWAIAIVQERFWGLSSWPRLVLLTNFIYWQGEAYFIDGDRSHGFVTRHLPIVAGGIGCSRTRPERDAIIDLRLLRARSSAGGVRIIGYVWKDEPFTRGLVPPTPHYAFADTKINVKGPTGVRTFAADKEGIFEVGDLAPDDYILTVGLPEGQVAAELKVTKEEMLREQVIEADFHVRSNSAEK